MAENLVNKKFGRLTVLEEVGKDKYYNRIYLCQCECGNKVKVKRTQLISGRTKSCGCLKKEIAFKRKYQNLVGKKFNKLTVLEEIGKDKQGIKWLCQCECGNTTVVHTKYLKSGNIKSCDQRRPSRPESVLQVALHRCWFAYPTYVQSLFL